MRFWTFLLLLLSVRAGAQTPFLPAYGSTYKSDHFTGFAEDQSGFYFCGGRDNSPHATSTDSVTSFCIRADSTGQILNRLDLNSLLGSMSVRFDGIGLKTNRVFITGTGSYYNPASPIIAYNKVFVLCLDTNLTFLGVDTFSYSSDPMAALAVQQTVFLKDRIVMGYVYGLGFSSPLNYSFLTVYDYNLNRIYHQPIDSAYLKHPPIGDKNRFLGLAPHSDSDFVLTILTTSGIYYTSTLIDKNINIIEWTDSFNYRPYLPSRSSRSYKYFISDYCPAVRHPSGAYFFGPVIRTDSGDRIGLSKANNSTDTVRTRAVLPGYYYQRDLESLPAFKKSVQLLRNQRELIVMGTSLYILPFQQGPDYIRVAKYDTALNLLWHRALSRPNTVFLATGIYELQDRRLMVLASAYNYTNATTASTAYDMYAFILDSTGTPLSTFTVPAPASSAVTLYPNPSHQVIRFSLPASVTSASYRLTDLQGRTIRSGTYASGNEISVAALPPANYLYQVHTADGVLHSGMFTKE